MSEDNWYWHMFDTVKGSDYLGDQDALNLCAGKRPALFMSLSIGMPFDRNEDGTIYQRPFGGHTKSWRKASSRACAAADRTGHAFCTRCTKKMLNQKPIFYRVDGA